MFELGQNRRLIGVSATDGLPSPAEAQLQRSELAKSARFGHGGAIRFRDAVDHVGDAQRSSDARTTGLWPSVLMQIKAEFQGFF